jgi:hypothetical protein
MKGSQISTKAGQFYPGSFQRFKSLHLTTAMRSERFFTKFEQTHARNFLKETVEHVLLFNPKPFVKNLFNTCLVKNP